MTEINNLNLVDAVIAFEGGTATQEDALELFGYLIGTGMVWSLQGHYGRQAAGLINAGLIDSTGIINWDKVSELEGF